MSGDDDDHHTSHRSRGIIISRGRGGPRRAAACLGAYIDAEVASRGATAVQRRAVVAACAETCTLVLGSPLEH